MADQQIDNDENRGINFQHLIQNADESLSILTSIESYDNLPLPGAGQTISNNEQQVNATLETISQSQQTSSRPITTLPLSTNVMNSHEPLDTALTAIDLSVQTRQVHIKAIFPDHSIEYVDVDPRFTSVGEMKELFCRKRRAKEAFQWKTNETRVMYEDQILSEEQLIIDSPIRFDGVIYIIKRVSSSILNTMPSLTSSNARGVDSLLSIPSISSAYPKFQSITSESNFQTLSSTIIPTLTLNASRQSSAVTPLTQSEIDSRKVRPEEKIFADLAMDFYTHIDIYNADQDSYIERLLSSYINAIHSRVENRTRDALSITKKQTTLASGKSVGIQDELNMLRGERDTWRLLYELRRICRIRNGGKGMTTSSNNANKASKLGLDNAIPVDDVEMTDVVHPSKSIPLSFEMMEIEVMQNYHAQDQMLAVLGAVKTWLETNAAEKLTKLPSQSTQDKGQYHRTFQHIKSGKIPFSLDSDKYFDPDSSLRYGDDWVLVDDKEDENELLQMIWNFIRAGKDNDALDLCLLRGQPWRAASLSGGNVIGVSATEDGAQDGKLQRWGNPFRMLWKSVCWKFSESKANEYERLIYSTLAGNISVVLTSQVTDDWSDHCWIYFRTMIEYLQDQKCYELLKVKSQTSKYILQGRQDYMQQYLKMLNNLAHLKPLLSNLDDFFERLQQSASARVREQALAPHCQIQAKLVTGKIEDIVSRILDPLLISADDNTYDWNLHLDKENMFSSTSPTLLRFAAHFCMCMTHTNETFNEQASQMIIKQYIRHLVVSGLFNCVPAYALQLPKDGCIEIYVQMLEVLEDTSDRETLCHQILETTNMSILSVIVTTTVKRLFVKYEAIENTLPERDSVQVTNHDNRRMRSLDYLLFYDEHRADALYYANLLSRQFAREGKFSSIQTFWRSYIPDDSLGVVQCNSTTILSFRKGNLDTILREHLCWQSYVDACARYDSWRDTLATSVGISATTFTTYSGEKEELTALTYNVHSATAALRSTLNFENGWLLKCSDSDIDDKLVRAACLPLLVKKLQVVYLESAKAILRFRSFPYLARKDLARPLLKSGLSVADLVVDEHYEVYQTLTPQECRDVMGRIHETSVALLHINSSTIDNS